MDPCKRSSLFPASCPGRVRRCSFASLLAILTLQGSTHIRLQAPLLAEPPQPLQIETSVEPARATIGDPLHYTIRVTAPPDAELELPRDREVLGPFTVLDVRTRSQPTQPGHVQVTQSYTLAAFDTGPLRIPAPTVRYRWQGQSGQVHGAEQTVEIVSVLPANTTRLDLRDIKPLLDPAAGSLLWFVSTVVGLLLLLACFLYFLLRKRRPAYTVPAPPAHERALRALDGLWARGDLQRGSWDAFYRDLSAILRRYLEEQFEIRAAEMTTEEFLAAARYHPRLAPTQRTMLAEVLTQADLVKFARAVPAPERAQDAYQRVRTFVEETARPAQTTPEAAHAA